MASSCRRLASLNSKLARVFCGREDRLGSCGRLAAAAVACAAVSDAPPALRGAGSGILCPNVADDGGTEVMRLVATCLIDSLFKWKSPSIRYSARQYTMPTV